MKNEADTTVIMVTHDEPLARRFGEYIIRMATSRDKRRTGTIAGLEYKDDSGDWHPTASFEAGKPILPTYDLVGDGATEIGRER